AWRRRGFLELCRVYRERVQPRQASDCRLTPLWPGRCAAVLGRRGWRRRVCGATNAFTQLPCSRATGGVAARCQRRTSLPNSDTLTTFI
ncbi:unnamed protein product, partial [Ectocarpus sp. 12 AP-2014]